MVCEFLPKRYKERLIEIASTDDLVSIGYTRKSARNVKNHKIISDERCEQLVKTLGTRALPIVEEALQEFTTEVNNLREGLGIHEETGDELDRIYDQVKDRLGQTTIEILRQQMGMTLERFLAKYRDYIMRNYELYPGGKEGIVLNGIIHGVIRKKGYRP